MIKKIIILISISTTLPHYVFSMNINRAKSPKAPLSIEERMKKNLKRSIQRLIKIRNKRRQETLEKKRNRKQSNFLETDFDVLSLEGTPPAKHKVTGNEFPASTQSAETTPVKKRVTFDDQHLVSGQLSKAEIIAKLEQKKAVLQGIITAKVNGLELKSATERLDPNDPRVHVYQSVLNKMFIHEIYHSDGGPAGRLIYGDQMSQQTLAKKCQLVIEIINTELREARKA